MSVRTAATTWLPLAALLAMVFAALAVRCQRPSDVIQRDGSLRFYDNDTVRRLERMRTLATASEYPVVEVKDGYPQGCVGHWTRPMDWTIAALDRIAAPFCAGARPNEAGALIAGPVLACLSLLLLYFGTARLLGVGPALLVCPFYAFAYGLVNVSWLGNGDHQNLQHLLLVGFAMAALLTHEERVAGRRRTLLAAVAGCSLGAAVWVSTESLLLFYLWVIALGVRALALPPARGFWRDQTLLGLGMAAILLAGIGVEQRSWDAFEIDKVSWFQLYQVLVWLLFVGLGALLRATTRTRVALAAALAAAAGLLPLLLTGLGASVRAQIDAFAPVNLWLQSEVAEFGNLLQSGGGFSLWPASTWFSFLVFGLPLFLAGVFFSPRLTAGGRAVLVILAAGTFALACWEMKLAHLFALFEPLVLVLGADGLWRRLRRRPPTAGVAGAFAALLLVAALTSLPQPYGADPQRLVQTRMYVEAAEKLRARRGEAEPSVLAPWDLGAHLMYYGDLPVLASGYHRNLQGILEGNRLFFAQPEDDDAVRQQLRARRIGWVVAWWAKGFLYTGAQALGGRPDIAQRVGAQILFTERTRRTLFWRLRYGSVPGFALVESGPEITVEPGSAPEPIYRIFRVAR